MSEQGSRSAGARGRPRISVVIAVHNGEETLGAQLEALAGQTYRGSWELIIADNGSTDGTRALAESWTDRLPELHVVDVSERRGVAAARNLATEHVTGGTIAFCDDDDVVDSEWLEALYRASGGSDMVAGALDFTRLNADGEDPSPIRRQQPTGTHGFLPFGVTANMAVSTDVFRALGGFDEQFRAESDVEFSWRLQLAGYRFRYEPAALVHKRRRGGLRRAWDQHFVYGLFDVRLYDCYRSRGMRRRPGAAVRVYAWIVWSLPRLRHRHFRGTWIRACARRWGRLVGSVRMRVLYL